MQTIQQYREKVRENMGRVAELGDWPAWIDPKQSLLDRVPVSDDKPAAGFDAGIACALDLIPRDKQRLSATLHAAYTEEAVEQVRRETADLHEASDACWWLAASFFCREGEVGVQEFIAQMGQFSHLMKFPTLRLEAAQQELVEMKGRFRLIDGIPFVIQDGGLQGAYILGHDWGVQYVEAYGIFFIGTFRPSLGLEDFVFSDRVDGDGRPMSGPVHGSQQFVKASSFSELHRAIEVVKAKLG